MRNSVMLAILLLALVTPALLHTQSTMPQMSVVEPGSGTNGQVLTVTGENLGRDLVAALYLTDGTLDLKVVITEQTATSIKFRIPAEAKAGRFALMVLTKGKEPKLIEEPVKITVETPGTASAL